MAVNIFKDKLRHAQWFGKPVLAADQPIPRETVPDGWYCYDMRGTGSDPAAHAELVDYTSYYHSGTVLSPKPLKRPTTKARRIGKEMFQRLKRHLERESARTGKKVSQKEFVLGLIQRALDEAEQKEAGHGADLG